MLRGDSYQYSPSDSLPGSSHSPPTPNRSAAHESPPPAKGCLHRSLRRSLGSWGNFIDGGANARLYTRPTTNGGNDAFRRGSGSASLSNKKGDASSIFTRDLTAEVSFFGEIKVKFWAYVFSFEKDEGFFPRVHHGRDDLDRRCAIHQQ